MGKALIFLQWDMHSYNSDNNYSLFNFTMVIHVFYDKDKFTNFKRVTKG